MPGAPCLHEPLKISRYSAALYFNRDLAFQMCTSQVPSSVTFSELDAFSLARNIPNVFQVAAYGAYSKCRTNNRKTSTVMNLSQTRCTKLKVAAMQLLVYLRLLKRKNIKTMADKAKDLSVRIRFVLISILLILMVFLIQCMSECSLNEMKVIS